MALCVVFDIGYGPTVTPKIRLTAVTRMVLDVIVEGTASDDPPWGYRICHQAGLGSGTVYPALERLEEQGVIEGTWETGLPADRPRRRFYAVTGEGRAWYESEKARRRSRTPAWSPVPHGGPA